MATQLPLEKAIIRIQDNDTRFNTFINGDVLASYKIGKQEVPSIQNFLSKKNAEINNTLNTNLTHKVDDAVSLLPIINFIGEFITAPAIGINKKNSVYKNTTDNNTYIAGGTPLTWGLFLESGILWDIKVESSNGTAFRYGQFSHTMLIAHVFRNGVDVTEKIQSARFRWRRVSYIEQPSPNDDSAWNLLYSSGYKEILVSVDDMLAKATFHCDIIDL